MQELLKELNNAKKHLKVLDIVFSDQNSYGSSERVAFETYTHNKSELIDALSELEIPSQIYGLDGRQMMLADLLEYIFLGRGYYSINSSSLEERQLFVKAILRFVNMLMSYEILTNSDKMRRIFMQQLAAKVKGVKEEDDFDELLKFKGLVGLPPKTTEAPSYLNNYFDTLLPKTAGGLWHELLVFAFMLRENFGYIVPLLLVQRLYSRNDYIIPPDFLIITHTKDIYGIEVGRKKEIQSGSFSIKTNIPTASLDTENSRVSDRCPICHNWIPFCDHVINNYCDFSKDIARAEVRCLQECKTYTPERVSSGECKYTKYSRSRTKKMNHDYTNNLHYHYKCVLDNLPKDKRKQVIEAQDSVALKTHYPYYSGLEALKRNKAH